MLDPTFSIVNWVLFQLGLIRFRVDWLGGPVMALWSVILVNVWRGTPFFAITLLAGLQTISPEVYEAASIDGANAWQRFWTVTWPLLMPVTMVVMLFSVIQTFADFQLVYILTGGGPANSTHLFATYAYQIGDRDREARRRGGGVPGHVSRAVHGGPLPALVHPPRRGRRHEARCLMAAVAGALVEAVGVPVPAAGGLRHRDAVPLLLHGGDQHPTGPGDVHPLEPAELRPLLDPQAHAGALRPPLPRDALRSAGCSTR